MYLGNSPFSLRQHRLESLCHQNLPYARKVFLVPKLPL
jgi:hypothetical protein